MMQKNTFQLLNQEFGIHESVLKAVSEAEEQVKGIFQELDDIMAFNQYKVLDAFQKNRITDMHFGWNTGYQNGSGSGKTNHCQRNPCVNSYLNGNTKTGRRVDLLYRKTL
jgi:hypothetical protein